MSHKTFCISCVRLKAHYFLRQYLSIPEIHRFLDAGLFLPGLHTINHFYEEDSGCDLQWLLVCPDCLKNPVQKKWEIEK